MLLEKEIVIKALKTPYKRILDFAMTYVSLSKKELQCIELCIIQDLTEEEAATELERSRDYVALHKGKAIKKLQQAWGNCELIPILVNYK